MNPSSLAPTVVSKLNQQLNHELGAAHGYLAISLWCEGQNLKGFAAFFDNQAKEERAHAEKLTRHLINRGGTPEIEALPAPKQNFKTLLEVALLAQAMEQANTRGINEVFEAALTAKDYPVQVLMHWFINEQVEEEAWTAEMIDRIRSASCAGSLSDLDRHIGRLLGVSKE
jgi:ferritin